MKLKLRPSVGVLVLAAALNSNFIRADTDQAPEDFSALILRLENPNSSNIAIDALARKPNSIPAVIEALRTSPHVRTRSGAARALGGYGWSMKPLADRAESVSNALIAAMSDVDQQVRCNSVIALGYVHPVSAINATKISEATADSNIRLFCSLTALDRTAEYQTENYPALGQRVLSHLSNTDPNVRAQVATLLYKLKVPAEIAVPALKSTLKDPDTRVNYSAMLALNSYATPEALEATKPLMEAQKRLTDEFERERSNPSMFASLILPTLSPREWCLIATVVFVTGVLSTLLLYRWPKTIAVIFAATVFIYLPLAILLPGVGRLFGDEGVSVGLGVLEVIFFPGFLVATLLTPFFDSPTANIILRITNTVFWGAVTYGALSGYGYYRRRKAAASN